MSLDLSPDPLPGDPAPAHPPPSPPSLALSSPAGRTALFATTVGAALGLVDMGLVNVALASLGRGLQTSFSALQWLLCAQLVPMAALLLFGGSLGERLGRRKIFTLGLLFLLAGSGLASWAPQFRILLAGRALQGLGAALLLPTSYALLRASFSGFERARTIALWSGLCALLTLGAPLAGGALAAQSWRWVFLFNLPLGLLALVCSRALPESRDRSSPAPDYLGALTGLLALGGLIYAAIEGPARGWDVPPVLFGAAVGLAATALFVRLQIGRPKAMVPMALFGSAIFTGASLITFLTHFALMGGLFLLTLQLQLRLDFSPVQAGAALLPTGLLTLLLSPPVGRWLRSAGHRLLIGSGGLLIALSFLLLRRVLPGAAYPQMILPALLLLGIGLAMVMGPLSSAILKSAGGAESLGRGAALGNAVAQCASVSAVALLPWLGGHGSPAESFGQAMKICAGFAAGGALCAWFTLGALDRRRKTAPPRHARRAWVGSQALRR